VVMAKSVFGVRAPSNRGVNSPSRFQERPLLSVGTTMINQTDHYTAENRRFTVE
jgi:hypothetical protein